jgi:hypothetical protein
MLRRPNCGPTHVECQSEAATMHWTAGWADDASDPMRTLVTSFAEEGVTSRLLSARLLPPACRAPDHSADAPALPLRKQ